MFFDDKLFLIAGPCVIEDDEMMFKVADTIKRITKKLNIQYIFKASFDKANRSSISSYRGPGLDEGLKILEKVKIKFDLPILTDVHTPDMIGDIKNVVDIIQLPAFLSRQTDFYIQAGKHDVVLNIKKGQFMSPYEMKNAITKFKESGGKECSVTERGSFFGYGDLVVDFRSIPIIKSMGVKYIYDATHSLQKPAGKGTQSGGLREYIPALLKGQIAAGADGIFMEVHPCPQNALCDSDTQYPLEHLELLLKKIVDIYNVRD